ncbi:hypothetical protein [Sphingomonas zeae]|uniref:Uncharacterized protein n=1 Tax=Sphingomonas zeae TaxID=1646122 RepID=A0A7Y6B1N6_9SPHN|nr:hypothetical protein [Sphingomonas zeae]MBB4050374.1 hypothetical protein [Sphingomonas zeae]NUU45648.1 hypothetical protein [Sphingomonas zeae]
MEVGRRSIPVEELFGRVADAYVQATRLKAFAPVSLRFPTPGSGAGVSSNGTPPTGLRPSATEGDDDWGSGRTTEGTGLASWNEIGAGSRSLNMPVQTVPFVPIFILGAFFLIAPGMVVTLFTNSDPLGFAVVVATAIAALVRPTASWILFAVLCSMRTVPFIVAALTAVAIRIGLAQN